MTTSSGTTPQPGHAAGSSARRLRAREPGAGPITESDVELGRPCARSPNCLRNHRTRSEFVLHHAAAVRAACGRNRHSRPMTVCHALGPVGHPSPARTLWRYIPTEAVTNRRPYASERLESLWGLLGRRAAAAGPGCGEQPAPRFATIATRVRGPAEGRRIPGPVRGTAQEGQLVHLQGFGRAIGPWRRRSLVRDRRAPVLPWHRLFELPVRIAAEHRSLCRPSSER